MVSFDAVEDGRQFMREINTTRCPANYAWAHRRGGEIIRVYIAPFDFFNKIITSSEKLGMRELPFLIFGIGSSGAGRLAE